MGTSYGDFIANSNLAFASGEFEAALNWAKRAINEAPKEVDAYECAGKACISLDDAK